MKLGLNTICSIIHKENDILSITKALEEGKKIAAIIYIAEVVIGVITYAVSISR